jgi:hypothetical protein
MAYRQIDESFAEDVIEEMIAKLEQGDDMAAICSDPRMPSVSTFWRWSKEDDELGKRIVRAREIGYYYRADLAVKAAKEAEDAGKGRLAFDAERWRLGKLSNAFADKVKHVGGDEGDNPIAITGIDIRIIDPA